MAGGGLVRDGAEEFGGNFGAPQWQDSLAILGAPVVGGWRKSAFAGMVTGRRSCERARLGGAVLGGAA